MSLTLSQGMRDFIANKGSFQQALRDCRLLVYADSNGKPASADTGKPVTSTLLATFTPAGATFTAETAATATIQLTGGASGSVDQVYIGANSAVAGIPLLAAAVAFNATLDQTASDLADAINAYMNTLGITAAAVTDTVTLTLGAGLGAGGTSVTVDTALTTITTTVGDFAGGVDAANGGQWLYPVTVDASGNIVLTKEATVWQSTAVAAGAVSWFRFVLDGDDGTATSTAFRRVDGTAGTASTSDIVVNSTAIALASVQTINTFKLLFPAAQA